MLASKGAKTSSSANVNDVSILSHIINISLVWFVNNLHTIEHKVALGLGPTAAAADRRRLSENETKHTTMATIHANDSFFSTFYVSVSSRMSHCALVSSSPFLFQRTHSRGLLMTRKK